MSVEDVREMDGLKSPKELDEQRRLSELSTLIAPFGSIAGTLLDEPGREAGETIREIEEDGRDDASSYHTTNSRVIPLELDATDCTANVQESPTERRYSFRRWFSDPFAKQA